MLIFLVSFSKKMTFSSRRKKALPKRCYNEDELDGIDTEAVTRRCTIRRVFGKSLQNSQSRS